MIFREIIFFIEREVIRDIIKVFGIHLEEVEGFMILFEIFNVKFFVVFFSMVIDKVMLFKDSIDSGDGTWDIEFIFKSMRSEVSLFTEEDDIVFKVRRYFIGGGFRFTGFILKAV